ncbi:MAG TPA: hypothetical protein VFY71_03025 [Planctomycetota bacterium]|nr:hypothetical protein [Planctomycetota bacterium]
MRCTPRWLIALVACLALVSTDGLHELSHWGEGGAPVAAPSGHAELHAGECPHRPHVPVHDRHDCLVCQTRAGSHAQVAPDVAVGIAAPQVVALAPDLVAFPGADWLPGVLGARGPPQLAA